jgi:5,10-methylene-tetrahydrofolate dehydrogenase/methenyl tetrahydrofolate cyclohydrolase
MLGDKERILVKWWEGEILKKVSQDITALKSINPDYAKRILQIFSYPRNQGNKSYVGKIIKNGQQLWIYEKTDNEKDKENKVDHRNDLYTYGNSHINKVIKSAVNMPNIAGIFITNPIKESLDPQDYQKLIDHTGTKDIDGQSTENKNRLKDFSQSMEWAIIHPTSLSVLSLLQKTLETTDLQGKKVLFAGKDGNFGSLIATTLERAWAETIGFNPRKDDKEVRYEWLKQADAVVSVIRGANYFTKEYFEWFTGSIIDVTTEKDEETGKTVWSINRVSCKDIPNTYIPSINGGVGTLTSALLMSNFPRCIINTEIATWVDPKTFADLQETISYADLWLNTTATIYTDIEQQGIEVFGSKEWFNTRLNTPNFYLNNQNPKSQNPQTIKDMLTRIEYGIPG